jgi:xylan 1,4-beta-xylosidase
MRARTLLLLAASSARWQHAAADSTSPPDATISLDALASGSPLPHVWSKCLGSGHAALTLREDWRAHVRMARRDLGVEKVRFHGILNDEMSTSLGPHTNSFLNVDSIVDFLRSIEMRAVWEIGFMPSWLAGNCSACTPIAWYKANANPPSNYTLWAQVVQDFAAHLVSRYGIEEMSQWPFEIWNEPNTDPTGFWGGTQEEYFELYRHAALAIKKVSPRLRVGGPVTCADAAWIDDLKAFAKREGVPLDFISTHSYTGANDEATINNASRVTSVLAKARAAAGELPLLITEFGSSYIPGVRNQSTGTCHDTYEASAFLARVFDVVTVPDAGYDLELLSYWAISDVFDESPFPPYNASFYGNFGLINPFGVPKPAYRLLQLLHRLGDQRLPVTIETTPTTTISVTGASGGESGSPCARTLGALAARSSGGAETSPARLQLLVYNQSPRAGVEIRACDVSVALSHVPAQEASVLRIDAEHANPKAAWEKLGAPDWPTAEQNKVVLEASELVPEKATVLQGGTLRIGALPPQGVAFVELSLT